MPESAGPGESVTFTGLPECNPTPSSAIDLRIVCCRMPGPVVEQRQCHTLDVVVSIEKQGRVSLGSRRDWPKRRWDDTPFRCQSLVYETARPSHVDDDLDLVDAVADGDLHAVIRRPLHDRADAMVGRVERLAVEHTMGERVRADGELHVMHHEALDVVDVEAFVDPRHQQRLGAVGLGAHLASFAGLDLRGHHDQREDAERRLRDGLRPRRPPRAHADVGLDLEVLPAGRAHRRSPKRDCRMATIAGPAVSVRTIRGPIDVTTNWWARAASTSRAASPPSGPTITATERGDPAALSASPSGAPPPSHRQSARSTGSGTASHSASGRGGSTSGMTARPHCLAASRATRCQRRARSRHRLGSSRTTVRSHSAGLTRVTPSSVAARTMVSSLSPLGTPWMSVIASGDSRAPAWAASTVPVTASPRLTRRTV